MLNLITKKFNPTILCKIMKYKSNINTPIDGWIDTVESNTSKKQNIKNKKNMQSQLQNQTRIPRTRQELFDINQYDEDNYIPQPYKDQRNIKQKKIIHEKFIDQKTLDQQAMQLFHGGASKLVINKFCRVTKLPTKMKNAQSLNQAFTYTLKPKQQKQILTLIRNYLNTHGYIQGGLSNLVPKAQKQLFKKLQDLLLKSIQQPQAVKQILTMFSQCNPHFIRINQIGKISQMQNFIAGQGNKKKSKFQVLSPDIDFDEFYKKQKVLSPLATAAASQFIISSNPYYTSSAKQQIAPENNQTVSLVKSLDDQIHVSKYKKMKISKVRLFVNPVKYNQFNSDQATIEKVQKKIFGNKKMITENIVFKRFQNQANERFNQYGENWVYAYDLPYSFDQQATQYVLTQIAQKYGEITEYNVQSFKNFVQVSEVEKIHILPFNFMDQTTKNKVKIQKQFGYDIQQRLSVGQIRQASQSKKKKVQSLVSRIIKKAKKYRQLKLDRSTMTFKFKNKQDKINFLSPQMRLYGLNLPGLRNIRFQQAQSKSVIVLSMIPWACQSSQLVKFINDSLASLKITVTHPKCIIAKGFIFIQLSNFYQAFYAKDLLNNLVFQNQRLKAQLLYGPSFIHQGKYKYMFEFDYFEELSGRLAELRNKHSQRYV